MFHTVVLQTPSSVHSLQLKSPDFLHLHGKRLCLTFGSMSMDDASTILSICTGIIDLAFCLSWPEGNDTSNTTVDKPSMAWTLSQLPLRHAELPCEQLVEIERQQSQHGVSARLVGGHVLVPLLQHLTALTHLAIDWYLLAPDIHERVDIASFLQTKPLLQIVLGVDENESVPDDHIPIDVRIVYLPSVGGEDPVDEWLGHGHGNKWAKAEKTVERRRRRERRRKEEESDDGDDDLVMGTAMLNV
ncbi:hypothetical protein BKA70DRAFT_1435645 [Coprinopsis sp. MPI-PUGE-AT-0042]|nr:hypothetical protein BKA70DRAFT_1435645 [Coprinopsis sp. MPI-PUGE-AT-0042]